jgi:CubicO group peptidase (beta-lactamase class C family)
LCVLQCVERGLIGLNESIYEHLPELEKYGIISENASLQSQDLQFNIRPRSRDITVRHLLLHTSGLGHEESRLIVQWREKDKRERPKHVLVDQTAIPLLFEPGEGWLYGASIRASQLLLERLTGKRTEEYTQDNVFRPLNMTSTTYLPSLREDICARGLKKVVRGEDGQIHAIEEPMYGLTTCIRISKS